MRVALHPGAGRISGCSPSSHCSMMSCSAAITSGGSALRWPLGPGAMFGMMTSAGDDDAVVEGMARALRPGGSLALSAFNAYFAVRYHRDADFDATAGVSHEITEIRSEAGVARSVDLWTGCYTPRELRLLLGAHGFAVESICSVEPGAYGDSPATIESPEYLVAARLV